MEVNAGEHSTYYARCRSCGSPKTARSRVRWFHRWRTLVSQKRPYRCFDCGRRFWAMPRSA